MLSFEMDTEGLTRRFVSAQARVDGTRLRAGTLSRNDWTALTSALGQMGDPPLYFIAPAPKTVEEIAAAVLPRTAEARPRLLVIDDLAGFRSDWRAGETGRLLRELKSLAERSAACILVVARAAANSDGATPALSDVEDWQDVQEVADTILILRAKPQAKDAGPAVEPDQLVEAEIVVAKQRRGGEAVAAVAFAPRYTRFEDTPDRPASEPPSREADRTRDKTKRTSVSKSIRFEVFKRDSFKCQYCGASAPDVLLVLDHIEPVSKGGDNDLTNLITACAPCNTGKRDVRLDDRSAVIKARRQLEELQERREQLEMMMQWRQGLRELASDTVDELCSYWEDLAPGFIVSEYGRSNVRKWMRSFSVLEITQAMDVAADEYLKFDEKGNCTQESWNLAFNKILGICKVERASKDDPEIKELYYTRGIVRNRVRGYFDDKKAIRLLVEARDLGVPTSVLRQIAYDVRNWSDFTSQVDAAIEEWSESNDSNEGTP